MSVHRNTVSSALTTLTWRQRDDVVLFERFKRWTPPLLALYQQIDQSSANRRLKRLVSIGALAILRGQPQPDGGRTADIYFLTPLGARLVTRLCNLGASYVEVPDVTNEHDNTHDLATLEIALRAGVFSHVNVFKKNILQSPDDTITLIPDLMFNDFVFTRRDVYVEVEQTARVEHFARKFETYGRLFRAYHVAARQAPLLVVAYPSTAIEELLSDDHRAAAMVVQRSLGGIRFRCASVNLDELRERNVRILERDARYTNADGSPLIEREGLYQCLTYWFDGEVH